MDYLKTALYVDIVMTLFLMIFFLALGGLDSVIPLLPILLLVGIAFGPIIMLVSWVNASFWQW